MKSQIVFITYFIYSKNITLVSIFSRPSLVSFLVYKRQFILNSPGLGEEYKVVSMILFLFLEELSLSSEGTSSLGVSRGPTSLHTKIRK
jgi:hypothetical protein